MATHDDIDRRSLWLARAVADRVDVDPESGLQGARQVCAGWLARQDSPAVREWVQILELPWEQVRATLLDESEHGQRLRQSSPFCDVLTPAERWALYREFSDATG